MWVETKSGRGPRSIHALERRRDMSLSNVMGFSRSMMSDMLKNNWNCSGKCQAVNDVFRVEQKAKRHLSGFYAVPKMEGINGLLLPFNFRLKVIEHGPLYETYGVSEVSVCIPMDANNTIEIRLLDANNSAVHSHPAMTNILRFNNVKDLVRFLDELAGYKDGPFDEDEEEDAEDCPFDKDEEEDAEDGSFERRLEEFRINRAARIITKFYVDCHEFRLDHHRCDNPTCNNWVNKCDCAIDVGLIKCKKCGLEMFHIEFF